MEEDIGLNLQMANSHRIRETNFVIYEHELAQCEER